MSVIAGGEQRHEMPVLRHYQLRDAIGRFGCAQKYWRRVVGENGVIVKTSHVGRHTFGVRAISMA